LFIFTKISKKMIRQSPGRIFKSQQRGFSETHGCTTYATFNFEDYNDFSRKPFGILKLFNEAILFPDKSTTLQPAKHSTMIVLPVYGGIVCSAGNGKERPLAPGDAGIFVIHEKGHSLVIKNPYADEQVNYLYIELSSPGMGKFGMAHNDLTVRNTLHPVIDLLTDIKAYMGVFDGREEALYRPTDIHHGLFLFVLNGAFEVQGRLLENRDALSLWDTEEIDMEALSNDAVILLIEVPPAAFTA
jgi:hypothetical protein